MNRHIEYTFQVFETSLSAAYKRVHTRGSLYSICFSKHCVRGGWRFPTHMFLYERRSTRSLFIHSPFAHFATSFVNDLPSQIHDTTRRRWPALIHPAHLVIFKHDHHPSPNSTSNTALNHCHDISTSYRPFTAYSNLFIHPIRTHLNGLAIRPLAINARTQNIQADLCVPIWEPVTGIRIGLIDDMQSHWRHATLIDVRLVPRFSFSTTHSARLIPMPCTFAMEAYPWVASLFLTLVLFVNIAESYLNRRRSAVFLQITPATQRTDMTSNHHRSASDHLTYIPRHTK